MRIIRVMSMTTVWKVTSYEVFGMHDEFVGQSQLLHCSKVILSPLVSQCVVHVCNKEAKQVIVIGEWARGPKQSASEAEDQRGA